MNIVRYTLGDFESENIDEFINFMNQHDPETVDRLTIYLKSGGGYKWAKDAILDVLKDYKNIQIYVIEACSAAFELLMDFDGKIIISDHGYGMYHSSNVKIVYNAGMKLPELSFGTILEVMCSEEKDRLNVILSELKFTKKEKELILRGDDVYFDAHRMKALFKHKLL